MRHYNATSNTCNRGATGCGFPSQVGFRLHINGTLILLYVLRKLTIFFLYFVGCLKTYGCHKWQSNHHRWNQTRKSIYSDIRISDSLLFALGCRYASALRSFKVRRMCVVPRLYGLARQHLPIYPIFPTDIQITEHFLIQYSKTAFLLI